jgi:hypothetical protein
MLFLAFPVAMVASGVANAALTNPGGTVTLTSPGGSAGSPYSSGQTITVTPSTNAALGSNNGAAGPYIVEECQVAEEPGRAAPRDSDLVETARRPRSCLHSGGGNDKRSCDLLGWKPGNGREPSFKSRLRLLR